jgi:glycosyltransferase involved in cell wall biosynthesis
VVGHAQFEILPVAVVQRVVEEIGFRVRLVEDVEAMSAGKPAFLSRLTSLPEIGGDAAYYFDSFEPDSMIATVTRGLADFDTHPQRPEELRAYASRYSWMRAATEYWSLYDEVFRSPRR